jgi:hypothetical protein
LPAQLKAKFEVKQVFRFAPHEGAIYGMTGEKMKMSSFAWGADPKHLQHTKKKRRKEKEKKKTAREIKKALLYSTQKKKNEQEGENEKVRKRWFYW